MFNWITPTVCAVLFVGFILYNLLDKYLRRIEQSIDAANKELKEFRKLVPGVFSTLQEQVNDALNPIQADLCSTANSLAEIKQDIEFFRGAIVRKTIDGLIQSGAINLQQDQEQ